MRAFLLLVIAAAAGAAPQTDDLAARSQRAKQMMAAGQFADAAVIYRELVTAVPGNAGLMLNLALAEQMSGRLREAVPHFQAAAKMNPQLFPAWVSLGACYLDLGEAAKAVAPLEKAVALAPADARPRAMLAEALLAAGRFDDAARQYRRLADGDEKNPKVWYGLGRSYEALAERAFTRLDRAAQGSAWWLALAAETRLSEGQNSGAFTLYRDALAKMPSVPGAHAGIAEVYRRTGHPDWAAVEEKKEARPDCTKARLACAFLEGRLLDAARGTQPPSSEGYFWQARAYNALAGQAFSHLETLPPSAELYTLRAQMEIGRGRHAEAVNTLRAALKLSPGDRQAQLQLAAELIRTRETKEARALLNELLRRDPDSAPANMLYGQATLDEGQPEKAIPYLEKSVQRDPGELPARAALGLAYARTGQAEHAIPHLKAALGIDTDGSLQYQLARAYQATGQQALAAEHMKRYQDIQAQSGGGTGPAITPP